MACEDVQITFALSVSLLGVSAPKAERASAQSDLHSKSIENEVVAHFEAGREATRAGQEQRAIQEYREVLRLMPNLTEARVNLGLAYFAIGHYQQASIALERARRERPRLVVANLFLGMVYQKVGLPAKAIPLLQEAVRQDSGNQQALQTLAACYSDLDNYRDALKVYRQLFAFNPDPIEADYALGQNYLAMAKRLSNETSRKFQGTPWEARLAGDVFAEQHRWVDAAAQYRRALALDAGLPGLHAALGDMLLQQGKREDADAEYRAELRRDAHETGGACAAHRYAECARLLQAQKVRSPEQDVLLGRALVALGDDQKAAGAFAEALNRDPANAPSRYWLIRACQRLALASFRQMMERAPDSWRVHQIQGEYYQQRLDYKKAIGEFQAALRTHPDSAELHEQLGMACLLDKNAVQGKAEIERALQLDPTRTHSLYLLGRMCFRNRAIPRSIEYFQEALRFDPSFLPARAALGRAYLRAGKPARAVPELEKAAPADRDGDLHYQLSMAYRQLGKTELAAQAAVSQQLRKKSATYEQAGVAAAEAELADH